MIYINGKQFYEKPGSCGTCPFYMSASTHLSPSCEGFCPLFDENHKSYINPPKRCQKLFNAAFRYPDGYWLVVVAKENEE